MITKSVRFREKSRISRNRQRQVPEFRKLQEAIWLTVINEIFKFPPHLFPFCQISHLFEHFRLHELPNSKMIHLEFPHY